MSDFIRDLEAAALPSYADEPTGDGLTRMQWRNGEPKQRNGGRFFVDGERLNGLMPASPWTPHTEVFESGAEAQGFATTALHIAIIGIRQQPFVWRETAAGRHKEWRSAWNKGEEKQGMQVDVLCFATGLAGDVGVTPVVWSASTIKTSFAIIGSQEPSIKKVLQLLQKEAKRLANRDVPPWFFWLPIATEMDAKGKVVYHETPGRKVTRPVAAVPGAIDRDLLNSLYVGRDLLNYGAELRAQYTDWLSERRTNQAPVEVPVAPIASPVPAAARRNVPQPVGAGGDDDLF